MKKIALIGLIILVVALVAIVLMKIIKIEFSRSDKRKSPIEVLLENGVKLTSCGPVYAHFGSTDFFTSSFKIETKDKIIYIDPIVVDDPIAADYIFITHTHQDHFSVADIEKLVKEETLIICPKKVAEKLKDYTVQTVKPGDIIELDGISCEAIAAYSKGFPSHPKSSKNVGYVIIIDEERIYHAGDTDFIPELKSIENITIALVPIDGGNLTMKTSEAVELINWMKPKIAIPMHYELEKNSTELFKQMINKEIEVIILN